MYAIRCIDENNIHNNKDKNIFLQTNSPLLSLQNLVPSEFAHQYRKTRRLNVTNIRSDLIEMEELPVGSPIQYSSCNNSQHAQRDMGMTTEINF